MAELLGAGVFIEEVAATTQVVGPVSTSTLGMVSWTLQGPSDKATLATSFDQYVKTFGSFDRRSFGAYSAAAFFSNGGRRLYQVRVTPDDAVAAVSKIQSQETDQVIETGDGATVTFTRTGTTSTLKDNNGASPLVASSVSIRWRAAGTPVVSGTTKQRDGTTTLNAVGGTKKYEGMIDPAAVPALDSKLFRAVPTATTTIEWTSGGMAKSVTIAAPTPSTSTIGVGTNGAGSTATLDFRTGRFSLSIANAETPDAAAITASYTPASVTKTITDNGVGALTGAALTGPGTISYTTGAYSFTTNGGDKPHNRSPVLATYKINAWTLAPVSKGEWANSLKVTMTGSSNFFTAATATYSRFNFFVIQTDSNGNDQTKETYEDLVVDDPTSAFFFADVVNEFSSLLSIATPGGDEAPGELNGLAYDLVLAGGDESTGGRLIQQTLPNAPVAKRSVTILYKDQTGAAKTIKDDGKGNLTGDVDTSYTGATANTVNYTTGALDFKTTGTGIQVDTLVTITWYTAPVETAHTEKFGDASKGFTAGTDGTFDSTHFGEPVFTSIALAPDFKGLYALDRVDELMQVIVPDFAGDITVTGDLLDYAATHASAATGGDRFIILTVPKGSTSTDAVDWFRNKLQKFSKYAALYWPWVQVADPLLNGRKLTMPVLGHVAGIYARTDTTRNVGKAPGGTIDGQLNFLVGLETIPTRGDLDTVYPNLINPLISSPQTGMAVWGVKTISQDSAWRFINATRLFMFLEKSIYNSTFWIIFENNGPALWARIKTQISSFLLSLFNDGFFAGDNPAKAFFVRVDDTNNDAASIAQGVVNIDVGVAVGTPVQFAIFRFQQITS